MTGTRGSSGTLAFWLADDSVAWPPFSEVVDGVVYRDVRHDVWGRAMGEEPWQEGLAWTLELTDGAGQPLPPVSGTFGPA